MSEQAKGKGRAKVFGLTRRDFLARVGAVAAGTAAASVLPRASAHAVREGAIGDWAADGSRDVGVPLSAETNASWEDGTFREHNAAAFPANDATPIPPRSVPEKWDMECDVCVVGAGGGGLNAAARAVELGARVICVQSMALPA